jgi:hypothetical protein
MRFRLVDKSSGLTVRLLLDGRPPAEWRLQASLGYRDRARYGILK